jgi:plastocyanin
MRRTPWLVCLAAAAFIGCSDSNDSTGNGGDGGGGGGGGGGGTTPDASVSIQNNLYSPSTTNITAGQTVRWTWNSGGTQHNVTFDAGPPNSPTQGSGTFDRTFATAGTYPYHCTIHGAAVMSGSVVVAAGP